MQKCSRADQPFPGCCWLWLVRVLCSGKTSAFQADDTGSIPVTRSSEFQIFRHLSGQQQNKAAVLEVQR